MAETKNDQGSESTAADAQKAEKAVEAKAEKAGVDYDKAPVGVESITEKVPSEADATSAPNVVNTDHERPPVATSTPDTPIAQTLAAGAGEHTPPDPDVFDKDGRPWGDRPH
jgi:hypothetical protein